MVENNLIDELVNSKIVHIGLLTQEQVFGIRKILDLDEDDSFDMIMLMDDVEKEQ